MCKSNGPLQATSLENLWICCSSSQLTLGTVCATCGQPQSNLVLCLMGHSSSGAQKLVARRSPPNYVQVSCLIEHRLE